MAVLVLAATGVAACSGGDDSPPTATVAAPSTTTTTAATDPYAVPAVIDAAYVNRVLAGLDAAVGDVVRLVVRTRSIPQEAIDRLRSLYADEVLRLRLEGFHEDVRDGFSEYRPEPGNKATVVAELITATPDCFFARVQRDYSAVSRAPGIPEAQWVALRRRAPLRETAHYNPTGWVFVYDGFESDREAPEDPCAGSS